MKVPTEVEVVNVDARVSEGTSNTEVAVTLRAFETEWTVAKRVPGVLGRDERLEVGPLLFTLSRGKVEVQTGMGNTVLDTLTLTSEAGEWTLVEYPSSREWGAHRSLTWWDYPLATPSFCDLETVNNLRSVCLLREIQAAL